MHQISNKKTLKGFTLVELIIVITILAILATIAFISFQGYTKDARDGIRISDIKQIYNGLSIYKTQTEKTLLPDNYINIQSGTTTISYQGYAGASVLRTLKISGGKDPGTKDYYIYTTDVNTKKAQLMTYMETSDKDIQYLSQFKSLKLIQQAEATNSGYYQDKKIYVYGDKIGILTNNKIPLQETTTNTGIDITTLTGSITTYFGGNAYSGGVTTSTGLTLVNQINSQITNTVICNPGFFLNGSICEERVDYIVNSNTLNLNLYSVLGNPTQSRQYIVLIGTGVIVGSNSISMPAFDSGNFSTGSSIKIYNYGIIVGAGGNGGNGGGDSSVPGSAGGNGGIAINTKVNLVINNLNGLIAGGGGGGGGGGGANHYSSTAGGGGGGGGAGYNNGLSGYGRASGTSGSIISGNNGNSGSLYVGGNGGLGNTYGSLNSGAGGKGGDLGSNGNIGGNGYGGSIDNPPPGAGGIAGNAVKLNGNTINWLSGNNSTQVKGLVN